MNKHNWTYKKLGEVASFSRGLTYSKSDVATESSKKVLRSNNIDLATHSLNFDDVVCLKEEFKIPVDKMLQPNDIFICMSNGSTQHLGKVAFIEKKIDYAFGGFMGAIHPNINAVFPKFAYYYCLSSEYRRSLATVLNGININNIKWSDLSRFPIPVPDLTEQERIAAELDLLIGVIDKKKAQLKEYDQLAQSIFYDMFGDPTDNPMGWEKDMLSAVCETVTDFVAAGSFADLRENVKYIDTPDYAQLIRTVDLKNGFLKKAFVYVNKHAFDYLWRVNLDKEAIVLPNVGVNCGEVYYVNPFLLPYNNNVLGPNSILVRSNHENHIYLSYFFRSPYFHSQIEQITNAVGQPKYNKTELKKLYVILPPLSLQQQFAERIEAIEKQKALVQASIAKTETLFNSRMDYYFN